MKKYAYCFVIAFLFTLVWEMSLSPALSPMAPALHAFGATLAAALGAVAGLAASRHMSSHQVLPHGAPPAPPTALVGDLGDDQWRSFIYTAADWFWETDTEHRFIFISDQFLESYGLNSNDVLGRSRRDLTKLHPLAQNREGWERHIADLNAHRPFRDFEYPLVDGAGRIRYARVSGVPMFADDGAFLGYRGFARDVTHERQADQALRIAKEEAELANRAKTEFIANMSHELRTPLNSIIGFSDILVNETFGGLDAQYKEYAGDINEAGKHLLQLINDLLDLARIERGQMHLNEQRLDLGLMINACHRLVRERALEAGVALEVDCPGDLPPLFADELRVKQAVVNLLSNAIKFTDEGGSVRITARRQDDGAVRVTVADTGIGIAPEDMATALAEFGQVDGALTRKHEGTGLGLTLARKLIELHNGVLKLDSEVGKGTSAHLVFPVQRSLRLPRAS